MRSSGGSANVAPMTRRELIAFATAAPLAFSQEETSILGTGWGLDHIEIAVRSGEAARETYFGKLGFTVSPGANSGPGRQHSGIYFGPPYVEFLWIGGPPAPDPNDTGLQRIRRKLSSGGGIFQYNIDVSNVESIRDRLTAMGMKVTLQPSTRTINGKEGPAPWRFLYATDDKIDTTPPVGVPGGDAVGIIEYRDNSRTHMNALGERWKNETQDSRRSLGEDHANTARSLGSVWVAVPDVAVAIRQCARFGFDRRDKIRSSALKARGEAVKCGDGSIEFWEPEDKRGALASILGAQGPGPFGFSVAVASLQEAREIVQRSMPTKLAEENRRGHKTFAVPAEMTGGVWVEFVQR
jgi:catechol 2,3-dioxygenase-like lactoylglutathione lyase family enzyme